MSFLTFLETLLIGPLKLVFEIIFSVANRLIGHPGLAIIALSLVMNILVLPLYRRADAMQEESRDLEAKLHKGAAHIKKTFSGDERMMILQTYYRQNHYKPSDALRGSVSLLLEIPFFMAAYQFLSHVEALNGVALGPISDLGAPDGLLVIGGLAINVLPFVMTLINFISSAIFLKGFPMKTKVQLYGMALFFLVFLYNSPSCLVFYWTLNNLFSLVKTIFYKLKHPQRVLRILLFAVGAVALVFGGFVYETVFVKRKLFVIGLGLLLMAPMLVALLQTKLPAKKIEREYLPNRKQFLLGSLFLTVLVGILIPSVFIGASPQEYVSVSYFHHPMRYILHSGTLAAGTFLIWVQVFYWLATPKGKVFFEKLIWCAAGIMLVNYLFFGTDLGIITAGLQYEKPMVFTARQQVLNLLVLAGAAVGLYVVSVKWKRAIVPVLLTAIIAVGTMSAMNFVTICRSIDAIDFPDQTNSEEQTFRLSKTGKNVIVVMLDRGMGEYIPYLLKERPQLEEQFAGFTYYPNTISFGYTTNFGAPPLLGGYEYTPVEMNRRDTELLKDKHNEALKMMPVLFDQAGYEVTVCDPPYANYQWIPDVSIYDEYPEINAFLTDSKPDFTVSVRQTIENNYRNFFCFAVMKTMPLFMQPTIYDNGMYNRLTSNSEELASTTQVIEGMSKATGMTSAFVEPYEALKSLPEMSDVTEEEVNTYLFLCNDTAHEAMLLQTPDYEPAAVVDNTEYDAANTDRFTIDGKTLKVENGEQMRHYHANMAALIQLGNWFDVLREQGVYDNTRIILVSDHGRDIHQVEELEMDTGRGGTLDVELFYPLMMVKDFGSTEFKVSDEFMTNADVPTLAVQDLIQEPRNPFTGKLINNDEKYAHDQYVIVSGKWQIATNNGTTFLPDSWASVKDDFWKQENWNFYWDETILKEHKAP